MHADGGGVFIGTRGSPGPTKSTGLKTRPYKEHATARSGALGKSLGVCQSRSCKIIYRGTGPMRDENTKQAAQEYLAAKLTEEEQIYEETHNMALAVARSPLVWKNVKDSIFEKCSEWNAVTQEETLTCKETAIGDIRIWCAARSKQMTVHYDSKKLLITVKNSGRLEHEKDVILHIEGYRTGTDRADRDVHLVRNEQAVNIDMLIVGELRVLTGMKRQRNA